MGLIPMPPGRITAGQATLRGSDILRRKQIDGVDIRGAEIGMIFQDPMTSLNPTMTIGDQIAETLIVHRGYSKKQAADRAIELLSATRIPDAAKRARQYPFEFSGGMLQRSMIAMAIACEPAILIADEPTTALDVTIQAQILDLMQEIQRQNGMAIILITHDLGVVARMADHVNVMYAGEIVERGTAHDIFYRSAHPYTLGLRDAMPSSTSSRAHRLQPIDGSPPDLFAPAGRLRLLRALSARDAGLPHRTTAAVHGGRRSCVPLLAATRSGASEHRSPSRRLAHTRYTPS